jgi:hypothetical protein
LKSCCRDLRTGTPPDFRGESKLKINRLKIIENFPNSIWDV